MTGYRTQLTEERKEQIIKESLPFIKYTAYRLARRLPPQLSVDDLISAGIVGLLDALGRYEEGRVKLKTFAEHRIRGAMLDEIRAHDWVPRSTKKKIASLRKAHRDLEKVLGRPPHDDEVAESLGVSLEDYHRTLQDASNAVCYSFEDFNGNGSGDGDLNVTECIRDPDAATPLETLERNSDCEALAQCIERLPEKEKLVLSLYYWDELTMKEIGKVLGLTEGRVCQIHAQALIRLKAHIGARVLR